MFVVSVVSHLIDTTSGLYTGPKSIFVPDQARAGPIMFHVAPYLPAQLTDPIRKRFDTIRLTTSAPYFPLSHIGNDIVVLIFNESNSTVDPSIFKSQFNRMSRPPPVSLLTPSDVFVMIEKVPDMTTTHYRVEVAAKPLVRPVPPFLPYPAVFEKGAPFRKWLHTKRMTFTAPHHTAAQLLLTSPHPITPRDLFYILTILLVINVEASATCFVSAFTRRNEGARLVHLKGLVKQQLPAEKRKSKRKSVNLTPATPAQAQSSPSQSAKH